MTEDPKDAIRRTVEEALAVFGEGAHERDLANAVATMLGKHGVHVKSAEQYDVGPDEWWNLLLPERWAGELWRDEPAPPLPRPVPAP